MNRASQAMKYKICSKCSAEKPITEFNLKDTANGKFRRDCKICQRSQKRKQYNATREDPISVAKRIIKKCKHREKERLAKFIKRKKKLDHLPGVTLTKRQFNLDVKWLMQQRDKQENKCYYIGKDMIWSTGLIDKGKRINPLAVTIDRIDSNRGYVKNNCVLCCWWANCAKSVGTYEEMFLFSLELIKKYVADNY
jgi:hypothetical protein